MTSGQVWTEQQAEDALVRDVGIFTQNIQSMIKSGLSDNQFSAFVCLAYGLGLHAFSGSAALHLANDGQLKDVPDHIMLWDKKTMDEIQIESSSLKNRRHAEVVLWNT